LLGRHSTNWATPPGPCLFFDIGSGFFFPQVGLEPWSSSQPPKKLKSQAWATVLTTIFLLIHLFFSIF
jgi:hypothetical protein